jgi:hypothetical protein
MLPNYEKLKEVLEGIVTEIKHGFSKTNQVDVKLVSKFMVIEK